VAPGQIYTEPIAGASTAPAEPDGRAAAAIGLQGRRSRPVGLRPDGRSAEREHCRLHVAARPSCAAARRPPRTSALSASRAATTTSSGTIDVRTPD
jgi:hypothetical protein